jgi:hypothetical protein
MGATQRQERTKMQVNDLSIELLITDSGVALTFLDLAKTTRVEADRARRIEEAHTAYTSILKLLPRFHPTPEQKRTLEANLDVLRTRLLAAGVHIPDEGNQTQVPAE